MKGKKEGLLRADSGFYLEELLRYLEEEMFKYTKAVKMFPNVKSDVLGVNDWIILALELS
ncbi:MAG: hypothetical protein ACI9DJ_002970 [Algoriphagus sp.]